MEEELIEKGKLNGYFSPFFMLLRLATVEGLENNFSSMMAVYCLGAMFSTEILLTILSRILY